MLEVLVINWRMTCFCQKLNKMNYILLAETHIGYDKKVSVEGFHYFPVCRAKSANCRYYGGLGILTRLTIRLYVPFLQTTSSEYQWIKLDKNPLIFKKIYSYVLHIYLLASLFMLITCSKIYWIYLKKTLVYIKQKET